MVWPYRQTGGFYREIKIAGIGAVWDKWLSGRLK